MTDLQKQERWDKLVSIDYCGKKWCYKEDGKGGDDFA